MKKLIIQVFINIKNSNKYNELKIKTFYIRKGVIFFMENKNKNNKKVIIGIIVAILLLTSIVIGLCISKGNSNSSNQQNNEPTNKLEIEQGDDWDGSLPTNGEQSQATAESIEIPGYSELYVNKENPNIQLINPEGNTVYFVYTIKENEKIIYETKAIEPNKMVDVNLKDMLSIGEHNLSFIISTFDIETQAACNGATQEVKVVVQE